MFGYDWFSIIKLISSILATLCGLGALGLDLHSSGHLTKKGPIVLLIMAIIAGFTTFIVSFVEMRNAAQAELNTARQHQEQLDRAEKTLKSIERVLFEFQTIDVDVIYGLDPSFAGTIPIHSDLDTIAARVADHTWDFDQHPFVSSRSEGGKLTQIAFDVDESCAILPKTAAVNQLLASLTHPQLIIAIDQSSHKSGEFPSIMNLDEDSKADLNGGLHRPIVRTRLIYNVVSKKAAIHWSGFTFENRTWISNGKIRSLRDLGDAKFSCYLNPHRLNNREIADTISSLRLLSAGIRFDHYLHKISKLDEWNRTFNKRRIYFARLPKDEIAALSESGRD